MTCWQSVSLRRSHFIDPDVNTQHSLELASSGVDPNADSTYTMYDIHFVHYTFTEYIVALEIADFFAILDISGFTSWHLRLICQRPSINIGTIQL